MNVPVFVILTTCVLAGCARAPRYSRVAGETPAPPPRNPYALPLSTPGARFGLLPPAVQNTVRSVAGTSEIIDARRELRDGALYYKISFRDSQNFPPLFVGQDGSVLNPDLSVAIPAPQEPSQELKVSEVPAVVLKAAQQKYPGSEVRSVSLEHWGNHSVYVVTFQDDALNPKMHIVSDGTVLLMAPK